MNQGPEKKYNRIGLKYNQTRAPDPRIFNEIKKQLNCPLKSNLIDVGAGTGNYSVELARSGYIVHAVEPSELMQKQRKVHDNLKWYYGVTEYLSFRDNTFNGGYFF
jgi:ubiquinone/menaquinone biosynthesis C-methylase UbiE